MMNCGYDPDPFGLYDTPPIAPQMWQSFHIVGEMTAMAILGALNYRILTGRGQYLSTNVHEAVSKNTETDLPDWIFLRQNHGRLTCRHSIASTTVPSLSLTKDGRYLLPYKTYLKNAASPWDATVALLKQFGMQSDLEDARYESEYRYSPEAADRLTTLTDRLIIRFPFPRGSGVTPSTGTDVGSCSATRRESRRRSLARPGKFLRGPSSRARRGVYLRWCKVARFGSRLAPDAPPTFVWGAYGRGIGRMVGIQATAFYGASF